MKFLKHLILDIFKSKVCEEVQWTPLNPFQYKRDEGVNGGLVIGVSLFGQTVGDDHADGGGFVSEQ